MKRSGQVAHRQEGDSARGLALLDGETREALSRGRWRQPPLTRRTLSLVLTLVVVLHLLFALGLWYEMQPKASQREVVSVDIDRALIVRLIDQPSKPPATLAPAPLAPPPMTAPARQAPPVRTPPVVHEKSRPDAMVVQDHQAAPATAASVPAPILAPLRMPSGSGAGPATAATTAAKPADDRQIMQHDSNRMNYKATRFEKYFPPPGETAGGAVGRHIGDVIKKVTDSVCDPKKSSTASNLLCGAPPPPASDKDRDARLNLPPAHSLADDPNPPKGPSLESCIAEYRDEKPLSTGCPINTPDLAFKAEMRECIDLYREGKRLKTWCPLDTPKRAAAQSSP